MSIPVRKQVFKILSSVVSVGCPGSGSQAGQILTLIPLTMEIGDECHQFNACQQEPSSVRERALVGTVVNKGTPTILSSTNCCQDLLPLT